MKIFKSLGILLCGILLIKAILLAIVLPLDGIGLAPDEAQYWTWSQELDWGYYSKPPGIAWEIWLGTHLLGNTETGVRLGAMLIGLLLPLAVYGLAIACQADRKTAFWSGLVMAFIPLGIISSFLATTDGGYLLFWTLACAALASSISKGEPPPYLLIGLLLFFGALFKWPIYFFWVVVFGWVKFFRYRPLSEPKNHWKWIGGVLISLCGLIPSLIWNQTHDWSTFRHVFGTILGHSASGKTEGAALSVFHGNLGSFLAAQAGLFSPLLWGLLLIAFVELLRHYRIMPRAMVFCGLLSLVIFGSYAIAACFQKIQGNWSAYAYPTAVVFLCWWLRDWLKRGKFWLPLGLGVSILLSAVVLSIPYVQFHSLVRLGKKIPYSWNPFHHQLGWDQLSQNLVEAGYHPDDFFLFSDKYQLASILSFYSPGQKRAYFLNLGKARKNQFSYWPGLAEEQKGKSGFFVWVENSPRLEKNGWQQMEHYQKVLKEYFKEVRFIALKPLFYCNDQMAKGMMIFECKEYNGLQPVEPELY